MEIIIAFAVFCVALWWFFIRNDKKPEVAAPYKVEAPAPVAEPVEATKVEVVPAGTASSIAAPAKTAKAKAPAKTAKPKAPAKTAAKAPAKAPAKTAKAKAPAKPKVTVAK